MADNEYIDNDDFDQFDDGEDWEDDEDNFDCGMVRSMDTNELQGCMKAGSEECEWECPYRAGFEREAEREEKKRARKEKARVPNQVGQANNPAQG